MKNLKDFLLFLPLLALFGCNADVSSPVLTVEGGQIQGVTVT